MAAHATARITVPIKLVSADGGCATVIVTRARRRTQVASCPVEAPLDAPGPTTRRIHVFPCSCSWWSMVLADAVCWVLVGAVLRSGPHIRASPLGSFSEDIVGAQNLFTVFVAVPMPFLVSSSASAHPCPKGPARAASPASRTVALLADLQSPLGMTSDPAARTRALGCTACSSTAWSDAPMLSSGGAKAGWIHRAPQAVTSWVGVPPKKTVLGGGARLSALVATGTHCLPALEKASSQTAGGGGFWEEGGGGFTNG